MRFRAGNLAETRVTLRSFLTATFSLNPKSPRTPVPEVVAAIEARRLAKKSRAPQRQRRLPHPRRKVIYDDFGEPLRRIWQEE